MADNQQSPLMAVLREVQEKLGEIEMRQADMLIRLDRLAAQDTAKVNDIKKKPIGLRPSFKLSHIA